MVRLLDEDKSQADFQEDFVNISFLSTSAERWKYGQNYKLIFNNNTL